MIQTIRINNFRSLTDVTVHFSPITVLIGRSGTGKSNFVDAFRFLRDCVAAGGQANWTNAWPITGSASELTFWLRFDVAGLDAPFEYTLSYGRKVQNHTTVGGQQLKEERLLLGGQTLFHHQNGKWVSQPGVTPAPTLTGQPMLGAISGIPEVTVAYVVIANGIGCYDFPSDVLQIANGAGTKGNGFADRGTNYLAVADGILSNLQSFGNWRGLTKTLRGLNRSVKSLTLEMPNRNQIVVGHETGGPILPIPLPQESEGLRRFFAHLLALYQTPPKQVLLFEEPEKGIHPGALAALAEEFKICPEQGRGQVILTTHSPALLDQFDPSDIRVVEMKDHSTLIGPLAPEQLESVREHLLRPGELLTVDEARLPGALNQSP